MNNWIVFLLLVASALPRLMADTPFQMLWNDGFRTLKPVYLSGYDRKMLARRGLDSSAAEKLSVPAQWRINWADATTDWNTDALPGGGCRMLTRNFISLHSATEVTASNRCRLTIEAAGEGELHIGMYTYGIKNSRFIHPFKLSSEKRSVYALDFIPDDFITLRPFVRVKGDIRLFRCELSGEIDPENVIAEGEIIAVSQLPAPEKSDYPDCHYTARVKLHNIRSGPSVPREVLLVIPGFRLLKPTALAGIAPGWKLRLRLSPFESLTGPEKSVQQADDLQLFDLPVYLVRGAVRISDYSTVDPGIPFSDCGDDYVSIFQRKINPPVPEEADIDQQRTIAGDLARLTALRATITGKQTRINKNFSAALERLKAQDAPKRNRVSESVWRVKNGSF